MKNCTPLSCLGVITEPCLIPMLVYLNSVSKRGAGMSTSWWCHHMETFAALLAICAGNSPVPGEFPAQRPVTQSFDVFFDLRLNKRLSKQSWGWWFETLSRPLWRHSNVINTSLADSWLTVFTRLTKNHSTLWRSKLVYFCVIGD